ncbi:hypothetical protein ABPG74_004535 [Tetrahymena malaccensis]
MNNLAQQRLQQQQSINIQQQQQQQQQNRIDDQQIPQGFQLETKIRLLIQEIVDPALKKTEECVKQIEYFSQVLDENNKKFDHCYDVYEILNEKIKIRFNELDALTQKVAQIDSDQIINNGLNKQEQKELRQEISELKEGISQKSEQIQQLQIANEKLSDELIKANNKILDNKGEYQEKMGEFIKNHFSGFTNIQKEFSKIKEEFIMSSRGMEYHKQVFDELQSTLDLYKVERVDLKKKIESIINQIDDKVKQQEFNNFCERIEHSLVNGNDELRLQLQKFQKETDSQMMSHKTIISSIKQNEQVYTQSIKDLHNLINEARVKADSSIHAIQCENTEMKNEQKFIQKSIEDINTTLVAQSNITNEIKQNIRKELLKFDQLVGDLSRNQQQLIDETVGSSIKKLRDEIDKELEELAKQIKKDIKNSVKAEKETIAQNTIERNDVSFQNANGDLSNEATLVQSARGKEIIDTEIQQLHSVSQEQIELIVQLQIEKVVPQMIQSEVNKDTNSKKDFELMIQRSQALIMNQIEQYIKKNMVTESSLTDIKRDILKIEDLKSQMLNIFNMMKTEHENMNEKVEKMTYKLTTLQSDITIENEFINGQIKKVIKDKDSMIKSLRSLCQLSSTLSENQNILNSILLQQEFEKRLSQDMFDNFSNTVPSRYYSHVDGLIFEIGNEQSRTHPCKINYRQLTLEKYDLIRHSMGCIQNIWEQILQNSGEDFIDITPGKIFKTQMMPKIKYDLKPVRAQTTGKQNPRVNNSDMMNKSLLLESNNNLNMNKTFNAPQITNTSNQFQSIPSVKPSDVDQIEGKKKKNNPISLNHRKLLKNLKDFNQAHLINLQKQITKPQTVEKQFRKQSSSAIQQEMHKVNLTFLNNNNDTLKNNYTEN